MIQQRLSFLICLILATLSSCATKPDSVDPEYSALLPQAQTNCHGNEIVGVWVSKAKIFKQIYRFTLLLRPDGTGIERVSTVGPLHEWATTWKYQGKGVWKGTGHDPEKPLYGADTYNVMRYSNGKILRQQSCKMISSTLVTCAVFVRGDSEAAVNEHLKNRQ